MSSQISAPAIFDTWSKADDDAVRYCRALAMDAVQKAGNGHPGTAMTLAPVAYALFQKVLKHHPLKPDWIARDRFILSCGHSSLTLYTQLFLGGFGLEMRDLENFRKFGSMTPGHPEYGHTPGVETTTGPLGQGVANGVGMAMASRFLRGMLDPESANGSSLFDHNIWVIASDGDLQEGVSAEASSLAGVQALGNLKVIYDDNRISIEGDTHYAFTEDVSARYRSYGWKVIEVETKPDGDIDLQALQRAIERCIEIHDAPTLIRMKSIIAWPAPSARNTAKSHGSALGEEEIAATKQVLGLNPDESFAFPASLLEHTRSLISRSESAYQSWEKEFTSWKKLHPERAELLERLQSGELPQNWKSLIPQFPAGKEVATRKASGDVIKAITPSIPELWGGSADLAESNNTWIESSGSFLPTLSSMSGAHPYARNIHFGIREHAMGAIANGIALYGLSRIFVGTFLVFSDYMRGAVRLAALMNLPVTYIWTHDSIGLGEDGPTHQPIEHFAALRAIPNLAVIRPADANEVAVAWSQVLDSPQPAALLLSRQNLAVFDRQEYGSADGLRFGAYVMKDFGVPEVVLIATGSEMQPALAAAELLAADGIGSRVVSAPCLEWFDQQSAQYRESVMPSTLSKRVSIEAGISQGWHKYIGSNGLAISLDHFGASASASKLFDEFGFTGEKIAERVREFLKKS